MRSAVVLVGKERQTKMMLSHMVPYKGAGTEWVTALLGRDLRNFGIADNSTIVLKSDQEPALVDCCKMCRGGELRGTAAPPQQLSTVQFMTQNRMVLWRGECRVLNRSSAPTNWISKEKWEKGVDVHLPVMAWLAVHVADMCNKSHVYEDGKTAYEKFRGRKYKGEMLPFGCQVLHRVSGKPIAGVVAPRWLPGTWLGKTWSTDEHLVATETGKVVRARSVRRIRRGVQIFCAELLVNPGGRLARSPTMRA